MHSHEQVPGHIPSRIRGLHSDPVLDPERDSAARRFAQLGLMGKRLVIPS